MAALILFAFIIFVGFAVIGGVVVYFIINNQSRSGDDDLPPRGVPWDDERRN